MRTLVIMSLVLVLVLPVASQTVTVVQENVGTAGPTYYAHQRKIARTTAGVLVAAWNTSSNAGGQVVYSTYDDAFGTWSPAAAMSNAADRALQPALASDELGNVHAVWQQRATSTGKYQTWYSKYTGASWLTPMKISVNDAEAAEEATIEVDSRGYLWVVYNNDGTGVGKEFLFAIKSTDGGTTWSATADTIYTVGTLGSSIEVGRAALVAGPAGKMVAVWDNSLTGTMARREVHVSQYDGSAWQPWVMMSDTTSVDRDHNRYVSAAVDLQGNIYVFHTLAVISGTDPRPRKLLMHKKAWGDPWVLPEEATLASDTISFLSSSAVCDSDGVVHLAYRRDIKSDTLGLDEIVYTFSKDGGTTWATPIVVSRPQHDGGYCSIANRIRKATGIDILWRESQDVDVGDQATTAIVCANIPYSVVTSVDEEVLPLGFDLLANYPNPFNPSTTIVYDVALRGSVTLTVYDVLGREVRTLVNDLREAGRHEVRWDGRTDAGVQAPSGMYIVQVRSASSARSISMMLLK